jgi:hypothetical protein
MFRKRRGVPDWAVFFSDEQWREFERVVRAEITPRRISGDIRDGRLTDGEARYGLGNLAQMCHGTPVQEWPEVVARHFAITGDLQDELDGTPKARLVSDAFMAELPGEYVTRRIAEDLQLVLCWDAPDRVTTPAREDVVEHGDPEALLAEALVRTRAEPGLDLERHAIPIGDDTVELFSLSGHSFFTATQALWADELDLPVPEHGALVSVPTRHTVLAHPIRDASVIGILGYLVDLTRRLELEGPGSVSPHVYWLREGRFERLDVWHDDEGRHFAPSAEFTAMLEELV